VADWVKEKLSKKTKVEGNITNVKENLLIMIANVSEGNYFEKLFSPNKEKFEKKSILVKKFIKVYLILNSFYK
jgi:hypothetical protein